MTPTETLRHEHQIILMVLDAAVREAETIKNSGKVDGKKLEKFVDFIRNFADRCHHAKEEDQLFVKMGQRGMSKDSGPVAVMLMEHDQGRRYVKTIADAIDPALKGDADAITAIADNLQAYVNLLRAHIHKEDNILYPMADRLFSENDQRALTEAFDKIEAQEIGEGVHEKYHQLAHELADS